MILQSNPLLHWVPVPDDQLEEEDEETSSSDSSFMASTNVVNTGIIKRASSQRSINSICSTTLIGSNKKNRPQSLRISPPASPKTVTRSFINKSSGDDCEDETIVAKQRARNHKSRRSTSSLVEEISIPVPVIGSSFITGGSLGKLSRLKERFLGTKSSQPIATTSNSEILQTISAPSSLNNDDNEQSEDGESTPLVSELTSPNVLTSPDEESSDSLSAESSAILKGIHVVHHKSGAGSGSLEQVLVDTSLGLVIRESSSSSGNGRSLLLARQNAQDWENPETPV